MLGGYSNCQVKIGGFLFQFPKAYLEPGPSFKIGWN